VTDAAPSPVANSTHDISTLATELATFADTHLTGESRAVLNLSLQKIGGLYRSKSPRASAVEPAEFSAFCIWNTLGMLVNESIIQEAANVTHALTGVDTNAPITTFDSRLDELNQLILEFDDKCFTLPIEEPTDDKEFVRSLWKHHLQVLKLVTSTAVVREIGFTICAKASQTDIFDMWLSALTVCDPDTEYKNALAVGRAIYALLWPFDSVRRGIERIFADGLDASTVDTAKVILAVKASKMQFIPKTESLLAALKACLIGCQCFDAPNFFIRDDEAATYRSGIAILDWLGGIRRIEWSSCKTCEAETYSHLIVDCGVGFPNALPTLLGYSYVQASIEAKQQFLPRVVVLFGRVIDTDTLERMVENSSCIPLRAPGMHFASEATIARSAQELYIRLKKPTTDDVPLRLVRELQALHHSANLTGVLAATAMCIRLETTHESIQVWWAHQLEV
jgi:hypothetical protein